MYVTTHNYVKLIHEGRVPEHEEVVNYCKSSVGSREELARRALCGDIGSYAVVIAQRGRVAVPQHAVQTQVGRATRPFATLPCVIKP